MGTKILNGESGVRKKSSSTNHTPALVGYQVRHDAALVEGETRIKFMTDGILLREIANDLLLRQYSVIIL